MFEQQFYNKWNFKWRGVPQTLGLLAITFCLSTSNDEQILALSYNLPLTAAKNVKLHVLALLCWRTSCSGVVSEQRAGLGLLSGAEGAEEEVGGRVGTVWHGKTGHFIGPWTDTVIERAGGKTMRKTDITFRYNLCLKRHITGDFPTWLSCNPV